MNPIRAIALDVNETLLDLGALDPAFERTFGDAGARREWFTVVLRTAFTMTVSRRYAPFHEVGAEALAAVAVRRGVDLDGDHAEAIMGGMRRLPPHPEVPEALGRITSLGVPVAALTNSSADAARSQLGHAGLVDQLDMVISVESVGRFKPAPEVYHHGARRLGVGPEAMLMIAAHDWDVVGALDAGCQAAFVARPDAAFSPPSRRPELDAPDLSGIADLLEARLG